jgi:hypothetical protein
MDNLQLLVIFVFSSAAVTGFQLSSNLGKLEILPNRTLLERFTIPLTKKSVVVAGSSITKCPSGTDFEPIFRRNM